MIRIVFLFVLFFCFHPAHAAPVGGSAPQIEELLIRKAVQELKLEGDLETRFSVEMKRLGETRRRLRQEMASALQNMEFSGEASLKSYTEALDRYNQFRADEFNVVRKLLGDGKMREYLVFKHKLYSRFKELLAARETNEF